jgi:hypothetical protein
VDVSKAQRYSQQRMIIQKMPMDYQSLWQYNKRWQMKNQIKNRCVDGLCNTFRDVLLVASPHYLASELAARSHRSPEPASSPLHARGYAAPSPFATFSGEYYLAGLI